jgi:hypothetical protein
MLYLLLVVLLLVAVLIGAQALTKADPKFWSRNMRNIAGTVAVALSIALMMAGRLALAIPLALVGYYLLGQLRIPQIDWGQGGGRTAGQHSSIRTDMLEMTLDHDSGTMEGTVRSGAFSGRRLSELSAAELQNVLREARLRDPQAAQLLEAYIERTYPGASHGAGGGGEWRSRGGMTVAEAYEVLGLKPGASRDHIQQAHRELMKKIHPDRGGSTYLASKINEAKDVLLGP